MQSKATTPSAYLKELPPARKPVIEAVREALLKAIPKGYEEGMQYGMICWSVPHSIYPPGYHCDPKQRLPFLALANQKQYMSLYLPGVYVGGADGGEHMRWFAREWAKTGKKLDMGKCCLRFKKLEDLELGLVAELIRRQPLDEYVAAYERALDASGIVHKGKKSLAASKTAAHSAKQPTIKQTSKQKARTKKQAKKAAKEASKRATRS
jgi:hypothetical protein